MASKIFTGAYIKESIDSVLAQSYPNWELIIVDDCSIDNTDEIVASIQDRRIKYIKNKENSGAAVSRNRALREARGKWIAFLDSDDLWLPEKLEKQIEFMVTNNYHFSYTNYEEIDEYSNCKGRYITGPKKIGRTAMYSYCWPGCLTVMYDADKIGLIQIADIKKNNDNALFYPVLKKCNNAMGYKECLGLYRIRKGSISRNKFKMIEPYVKVLHDFEGHSLFLSYFCVLTHFIIKIFFKYRKYNF